MSETDEGCHMWPPTVHNEGHSPVCSGSPTVNTILSHWASFPPPCALVSTRPPFLSLSHTFLSSVGAKGGQGVQKREPASADLQDSLETSVGPRSSLLPPPVPFHRRGLACTLEPLTVPAWASMRGSSGWVGREGWSTPGLSTSLAARQSAQSAWVCLLDCGADTRNAPAPTRGGAWSDLKARW